MIELIFAVIIDLIIGDPDFVPHPVVIIGAYISVLEKKLYRLFKGDKGKLIAGGLLAIIVILTVYFTSSLLLGVFFKLNPILGLIINIWILSTTIAIRGLAKAGLKVYKHLSNDDFEQARFSLSRIVGRDTEDMSENEIARAVIETIAENTSDGIIAPIFFYIIGGIPLALTYKAINTLDSMLGYKNERYLYFGRISARIDDLVNFIPARVTGIGFCTVAVFLGYNGIKGWKTMWRDAGGHPSWNAGFPEGAMAGSLEIKLGGLNYYQGCPSFRVYMGEGKPEPTRVDIINAVKLMIGNSVLITVVTALILSF